jgi:hypothetical protein
VVFIASCPQGSSGVVRFLIGSVLAERESSGVVARCDQPLHLLYLARQGIDVQCVLRELYCGFDHVDIWLLLLK